MTVGRRAFTLLLLTFALVAAGGTAFLVMSLSGDDDAGRGRDWARAGREAPRIAGSGDESQGGSVPMRERPATGTGRNAGEGAPHGALPPGVREPFDDKDARIRHAQLSARVAELLDKIMAIEKVTERQKYWEELQTALRELGRRIDPALRDRLLTLLNEAEPRWRPLVGQTLGALEGDADTAKKLVRMLQERPASVYTRNAIYTAIGMMKVEAVVPDLLSLLGEGMENEELLVRAVGQIGGRETHKALLERIYKPLRPETRREIESVLGTTPDAAVLEAAAASLPDADPDARTSIVAVLGMARDPRYSETVIRLLDGEPSANVRQAAFRALGRIGDEKAGLVLLRQIEQGGELSRHATNALYEITNAATLTKLSERYDALNVDARVALVGAARRLPAPGETLNKLAISGLEDHEERVRVQAAGVLGRRGRDDHVEPISRFLDRARSLQELVTAMQALQTIASKASAEAGLARIHLLPAAQQEVYRQAFEKQAAAAMPDR